MQGGAAVARVIWLGAWSIGLNMGSDLTVWFTSNQNSRVQLRKVHVWGSCSVQGPQYI